jgi:hypothetical protein
VGSFARRTPNIPVHRVAHIFVDAAKPSVVAGRQPEWR